MQRVTSQLLIAGIVSAHWAFLANAEQVDTGSERSSNPAESVSKCRSAPNPVWIVPNTHGTATGWLTGFSTERNYMINNYSSFMDEAEKAQLPFVFSEVPTAIAMSVLAPEDFDRLETLVSNDLAAVTNAFAVEYDASFVRAATTYQMGRMAIDWFEQELGQQPDIGWYIDVLGVSPTFAENFDLLDVDLMVHERNAETLSPIYRLEAPSGASMVVSAVKSYAQWRLAFRETGPLPDAWRNQLLNDIRPEVTRQPDLPFLWTVGAADYSKAPDDPGRLAEMAAALQAESGRPTCLGTTEDFQDSLEKAIDGGADIPVVTTPGIFGYNAFWSNLPQVKQSFRSLENTLSSTEMAAAIASVDEDVEWPTQTLYDAWWLLLLNADRALVWGAGSDDPFIGENEWNVADRSRLAFEKIADVKASLGDGYAFDPIGWTRTDAYDWEHQDKAPSGAVCETEVSLSVPVCRGGLEGFNAQELANHSPATPSEQAPATVVETNSFRVEFDERSGDLLAITNRQNGTTIKGRLNEIVFMVDEYALEQELSRSDFLSPLPSRNTTYVSRNSTSEVRQWNGPVFRTVEVTVRGDDNSTITRTIQIPHSGDQIRFFTETENVPDSTLVVARFDLGSEIERQLRGAAMGYDRDLPRPARDPDDIRATFDHGKLGLNERTAPAILWSSHFTDEGSGLVLYDRGLLGRDRGNDFIDIHLMNAQAAYRNKQNRLLSGSGSQDFAYALSVTDAESPADFARAARAYNMQPFETGQLAPGFSMSDTMVIERISRSGDELEILAQNVSESEERLEVSFPWTHERASIKGSSKLEDGSLDHVRDTDGARTYLIDVAQQDAFILRLHGLPDVGEPALPKDWSDYVPAEKLDTLGFRDSSLIGHPPED